MISIILASTSVFRKELLQRLDIPFTTQSPNTDETPLAGETADALVRRLASDKAQSIQTPHSVVIGSDQVAVIDQQILGKPNNKQNAIKQLQHASAKTVVFYTGLCVFNTDTQQSQVDCITYSVTFRTLSDSMIENYLDKEQPYNCAGSFKSEKLGVALFERMVGDDPTALIGLPLIRLTTMLAAENIHPI